MSGGTLHWLAPDAAWLAAPLLAVFAWAVVRSRATARPAGWLALLGGRPLPTSWRARLLPWPRRLEGIALLLLLVALLRPAEQVVVEQPIEGIDLVLVVDRSSSMAARDLGGGATRLALAQQALADLLARRPEDRIALVTFARWPDVKAPLTRDHAAVARALAAIETVAPDSPEDATGIGTALARAAQLLQGGDGAARVVVLLTDGEENVASVQTPQEIAPLHAAQWCAQLGVRVDPIVVGRDELDTREVDEVAQRTGGASFRARDAGAVAAVGDQIDRMERARRSDLHRRHDERFAPLVIAALATAAIAALLVALGVALDRDRPAARARRVGGALRIAAALLAVAALFQPTWGRVVAPFATRGDLVVCLDVSRSMLAADAEPTRLAAAQRELAALATRDDGERLGLIAFAGRAEVVVPLTRDGAAFAELAAALTPDVIARGGSDLGAALRAGLDALRGADSEEGALVVLSDGEDLAQQAAGVAAECRARGVALHAVGYGSPLGCKIARGDDEGGGFVQDRAGRDVVTRLDEPGLRALVAATGGRYVAARDDATPLATLVSQLPLRATTSADRGAPVARPLAPWLLLAAFAAALVALVLASVRATTRATALVLAVATSCSERPPDRAAPDWNEALAAHAQGERDAALVALERAAARDPGRFEAGSALLRGAFAFEEGTAREAAGRAASPPTPTRFDDAIAAYARAAAEFAAAARARPDWPEARRNGERALLAAAALEREIAREQQTRAADETRKLATGKPPPLPDLPLPKEAPEAPPEPPDPAAQPDDAAQTVVLTPQLSPLSDAEVAQIVQRLAEREAQKAAARAAARRAPQPDVERDW